MSTFITAKKLRKKRKIIRPLLTSEDSFLSMTAAKYDSNIVMLLVLYKLEYNGSITKKPFGQLAELLHQEVVERFKLINYDVVIKKFSFEESCDTLEKYDTYSQFEGFFFDEKFREKILIIFNEFYNKSFSTFTELKDFAQDNVEITEHIITFFVIIIYKLMTVYQRQIFIKDNLTLVS